MMRNGTVVAFLSAALMIGCSSEKAEDASERLSSLLEQDRLQTVIEFGFDKDEGNAIFSFAFLDVGTHSVPVKINMNTFSMSDDLQAKLRHDGAVNGEIMAADIDLYQIRGRTEDNWNDVEHLDRYLFAEYLMNTAEPQTLCGGVVARAKATILIEDEYVETFLLFRKPVPHEKIGDATDNLIVSSTECAFYWDGWGYFVCNTGTDCEGLVQCYEVQTTTTCVTAGGGVEGTVGEGGPQYDGRIEYKTSKSTKSIPTYADGDCWTRKDDFFANVCACQVDATGTCYPSGLGCSLSATGCTPGGGSACAGS